MDRGQKTGTQLWTGTGTWIWESEWYGNQVMENLKMAVQKNQTMANQEVAVESQKLADQKDLIIRQPSQNFLKSQLIVNVQDCH